MHMTKHEMNVFLGAKRPARLGVVATVRKDGCPQVVPVWYGWSEGRVKIWTTDERAWVQNAQRNARVAFSVHGDRPYPAVIMRGTADVMTEHSPEVQAVILDITRRYLAEEEVAAYIEAWRELHTIVTITPDRIVSWPTAG